jgi:hypothetical protein
MKLSHIILMYILGAIMLMFIKDARASYCTNDVYSNYLAVSEAYNIPTLSKGPAYKGQVEGYCNCIELIEYNGRSVTDKDIIQCAAMSTLYYTIRV